MEPILEYLRSLTGLLPRITLTGVIEIVLISLMVYAVLNWVMDTEAEVLLKGLFVIFAFSAGTQARSAAAGDFRFLCRERAPGRMEGEQRFFRGDGDPSGGSILQDGKSKDRSTDGH